VRILVADDDATTHSWLAEQLPNWGHEVVTCADGTEAWSLLTEENPPDIAILGRAMTGMGGIAICREIRKIERQTYTYVILLAENADKDQVVEALEAGADDHLIKPIDVHELQIRIRSACRIVCLQHDLLCALSALEFQAARDQLTGLWNRRGILGVLRSESARAVRSGFSVGVIMADLDDLRGINSRYGYPAGDAALREVAQEMTRSVRPYDSIGRLDGGTFALVLPGCDGESTRLAAERLRSVLAEHRFKTDDAVWHVTMSYGVVSASRTDDARAEWLIERADTALAQAKSRGRNRVEVWQT
jgi:two-component system, cell cycle response regulator